MNVSFEKLLYSESYLEGPPIQLQTNMVFQDRWSRVTGSVTVSASPYVGNMWSFKTGGLSR